MSDIALKSAGGKTVIASLASVLIAQGYAKSKGSKGVRPLPERCGVSSRERVGPAWAACGVSGRRPPSVISRKVVTSFVALIGDKRSSKDRRDVV